MDPRARPDRRPRPDLRPHPARGPRGAPNDRHPTDDRVTLYGWHPVLEALRNPARIPLRLLATENAVRRLAEAGVAERLAPSLVRPAELDRLLGSDAVHQGLYLEAEPLAGPDLDALPADALLVALDQVTDPHNVGAIVRSAAAFGVTALITTARHSPTATGVLAKAASGGLEHLPFVIVRNLAESLIALGKAGVTRVGLDSDAPAGFDAVPARRPMVLVLGAEGRGLRARTRDCCDVLARIDLHGPIDSLNVSNAAAVALYALAGRPREA